MELDVLDKSTRLSKNEISIKTVPWTMGPNSENLVIEPNFQVTLSTEFITVLTVKLFKHESLCGLGLCSMTKVFASHDVTIDILDPKDQVDTIWDINSKQTCNLTIEWSFGPVTKGPKVAREYGILPGTFYDAVMPETVESMWGPVPLKTLPEGTTNDCKAITHRYAITFYTTLDTRQHYLYQNCGRQW